MLSNFEISVVRIDVIQNYLQYTQKIDEIFQNLVETKNAFQLLENPSTLPDQFINSLSIVRANLLSVFMGLRAIDRFETNSPTNLPKLAEYLSIGGSSGEKSNEVLNEKNLFIENGLDPRVEHIAQWAVMGCLDGSELSGEESRGIRKDCWFLYETDNRNSTYHVGLRPEAGRIAVKQLIGQYTSLIGKGIGQRFGFIVSTGVNAIIGKFLDILITEETNDMILIVGEVQNDETVQVPAGEHEIVFTFEENQERSIVRNLQVGNNSSFALNVSPGEIVDNPPAPEPDPRAWQEDFEGTVPTVRDASTCHQDPEKYGHMSAASIVSGVAVSPTHSLSVNNAIGGFCFGGFLGHLDTISAYVRISGETTDSWLVLVSQGAAAPPRGCTVKFNSGSVDAYTADFQYVQQLGTYSTETFYKISFVVDLDNQSCRIAWADGEWSDPVASDTEGTFHHWSQLYMLASGAGVTMLIDDVESSPPPEPEPAGWNEDFESISSITQSACAAGSEGYAVTGHNFTINSSQHVSPSNALQAHNPGLGVVCFGSTNPLLPGDIVNMWVRFDSTSSSSTSMIKLVTQPAAAPPRGCMIQFRNGEVFAADTDDGSVVSLNMEQIGTLQWR